MNTETTAKEARQGMNYYRNASLFMGLISTIAMLCESQKNDKLALFIAAMVMFGVNYLINVVIFVYKANSQTHHQ